MAKRSKTAPRTADEHADPLHAGDLAGFISRRDELAKRLAKDGDEAAAKAVRALRKPSKVAWAINQISHSEPELRDRLLQAGAALRDAQTRQTSATERDAVDELVLAAQRLAEAEDMPLSQVGTDRARQTLHAVALDDAVREGFERGNLTEEHEAVGLGPLAMSSGPGGGAAKRARTVGAQEASKRRREALKAAESDERDRRRDEADAERELDQVSQEADQAQRALKSAREALERARGEAASAAERVEALREQP